jgi:Protein of unknown function (DUF4058)
MPSPFPGMNPYLESHHWTGVHHWLITELARHLNTHLRPKYYVAVEVRIYETTDAESTLIGIPDNVVLSGKTNTATKDRSAAVATLTEPVIVTVPMPETVKEGYLEVREAGTHKVITTIELLSPKNKQTGKGRTQYEEKRQQILSSQTHLVEIDLIRKFNPMPFTGISAANHYRILVSRAQQRPKASLYGFNLQDEIPVFPLPLRPDEAEFPVNLKPLLDNLYDAGAYAEQINYSQDPPAPKLSDADAIWCDRILQQNNLRPE